MSIPTNEKTPVAKLGGTRDEGLYPTSEEKQENTMIPQSLTPSKWCAQQRALERLDLPMLAHGSVAELVHAAEEVGVTPAQLLELLDVEGVE